METQKVMIFGTFDGLHEGHKNFIQQAEKLGQELFIIIARNENVIKIKNKVPHHHEKSRLNTVQSAFQSAKVYLGDYANFYKAIELFQPNLIALGYDQEANLNALKTNFPKVKIIRLKGFMPHKFKSSILNPSKNVSCHRKT